MRLHEEVELAVGNDNERLELREEQPEPRLAGQAHDRHRQPGLPAVVRRYAGSRWKINDPYSGKGYESAVAYAVAKQLGFAHGEVMWTFVPFNKSFAPGQEAVRLRHQPDLVHAGRAKVVDFSDSYYDVNQAVVALKGTPIATVTTVAGLKPFKLGAQLGTTSYSYIKSTDQAAKQPSVFDVERRAVQALKNEPDRRPRRRPADRVLRHGRPGAELARSSASSPPQPGGEHFGMVLAEGQPAHGCVNKALAALRRTARSSRSSSSG